MKAIATWHATDTIQGCREACGGAGYLRSSRFASLKADTDVFTTFEGDNTILLQLAAKNLLTDYKDAFGELDPLGMAQFVAGQALERAERARTRCASSPTRSVPGRDDDADLLDRKTQLDLFRWRHEHLLAGAARRLKGGIDAGRDPFAVLVDCQDHVLEAARAWVDLVDARVVRRGAPSGNAAAAASCARSTRCSGIEAERGYFQEHGRLSAARSKAVVKAVNTLCGELRPRRARAGRRVRRAGDRARRRPRGGRRSRSGCRRENASAPRRARAADARPRPARCSPRAATRP